MADSANDAEGNEPTVTCDHVTENIRKRSELLLTFAHKHKDIGTEECTVDPDGY